MDGYKRITEPPRLVHRNEETEASNAVSERRSSIFTSPLPFPHLHVGLGCGAPFRVNPLLSSPALPRRRKSLLDKLSRVFGRGKSELDMKSLARGHTMSLSTLFRRVGLKDLVSNVTVYSGASEVSGGLSLIFRRWATKKTAGSTKNGRDSRPKNLGVKKFGGEKVIPGNIIVRQRGGHTMSLSTLFRRVGLKDLVSNVTVYSGASEVSGGLSLIFRRWATKKTAGSTKNGRDSRPKNLGVKKFGGEKVIPGNIIVRQRGTRFHPGDYVGMGKDHTLFALKEGHVRFERHKLSGRKWVHVDPIDGHVLHPIYTNDAGSQMC
ncbi:hypothetical protein C4D60_Mb06t06800 [Musa balbisiana]|uniref:50S ribosomal protein L27 n=1 Tax=Musa balbisiana TaxID=52838 RepID=A0A4V4H3Q8_MUSBA|nr:hypothetical protein C4D60_Mb06t06800 [Musa balbisiana]